MTRATAMEATTPRLLENQDLAASSMMMTTRDSWSLPKGRQLVLAFVKGAFG